MRIISAILVALSLGLSANAAKVVYVKHYSWSIDELWLADVDGSHQVKILTSISDARVLPSSIITPAFSQDNKRILFVDWMIDKTFLRSVDLNGKHLKTLHNYGHVKIDQLKTLLSKSNRTVSPDAEWVVPYFYDSKGQQRFYVVNLRTKKEWQVPVDEEGNFAISNPSGQPILQKRLEAQKQQRIKALGAKKDRSIQEAVLLYCLTQDERGWPSPPDHVKVSQGEIKEDWATASSVVIGLFDIQQSESECYIIHKDANRWTALYGDAMPRLSRQKAKDRHIPPEVIKKLGWSLSD